MRSLGSRRVFERAQRFQQPEEHVAVSRILPQCVRQGLTEFRQPQRPVRQEENARRLVAAPEPVKKQPSGQAEPSEELDTLNGHDRSLQAEAGSRPLDEQPLVLAPNGSLGPMRARGHEPEERVEIEAPERTGMRPHAEVAFLQNRQSEQRHRQRDRR